MSSNSKVSSHNSKLSSPVIGIDIGGTKIRGILWDGKKVARSEEFATPKNKHDFQSKLTALTASLAGQNDIRGIGIGAAGIMERTTLLFSPNIPYIKKLDFRPLWHRSIPLRLDNDARSFARAEFLTGAGRGAERMFALTIGTGIGRSYGRSGKIMKLKKLEYPESWEKEYQAVRDTGDDKKLATFLADRLVPLLEPYEPDVVVVGGGVMEHRGFLRLLRSSLEKRGFNAEVRRAHFSENAVAIGAALLLG
jgi:predicted NBD/HSP70 family sugar kinase